MKETLSDKIYREELGRIEQLDAKDVREFIKKLKEVYCKCNKTQLPLCDFCCKIDNLAGDELI